MKNYSVPSHRLPALLYLIHSPLSPSFSPAFGFPSAQPYPQSIHPIPIRTLRTLFTAHLHGPSSSSPLANPFLELSSSGAKVIKEAWAEEVKWGGERETAVVIISLNPRVLARTMLFEGEKLAKALGMEMEGVGEEVGEYLLLGGVPQHCVVSQESVYDFWRVWKKREEAYAAARPTRFLSERCLADGSSQRVYLTASQASDESESDEDVEDATVAEHEDCLEGREKNELQYPLLGKERRERRQTI